MTLLDPDSHVCIVGCGLIGGSFALALRRAGFKGRLTAWDDPLIVKLAIERGVVESREDCFDSGSETTAQMVFLAAPIGGIVDFLRCRSRMLPSGTIVTDAGSTKAEICRVAKSCLPDSVCFIGGHPMAGSEHRGVEYSRADLFDRATWALVRDSSCQLEADQVVQKIIELIGARPVWIEPDDHDRAVALVSHLPQIISTTLATLLANPQPKHSETHPEAAHSESDPSESAEERSVDLARMMAAGGWRDMTRLAASSFSVWRDIIITNQPYLTHTLDQFISSLQLLSEALEKRDFQTVRTLFEEANHSVTQLRETRYRSFDKV